MLIAMIPSALAEAADAAAPVEEAVEEVTVELGGEETYELNGTEAGLTVEEKTMRANSDDPQIDVNRGGPIYPREWWDPDTGFLYKVTVDGVLTGITWL